jgi:hypothetical protein
MERASMAAESEVRRAHRSQTKRRESPSTNVAQAFCGCMRAAMLEMQCSSAADGA